MTLVAASAAAVAADTGPGKARTFTIVLVGDTGFGASLEPVTPLGARRSGGTIPFERMSGSVKDLIAGDIVFANLETVVTARNGIPAVGKAFNFRTHPNGVEHLMGLGFNLFSLANNHAIDFGLRGMADTLAAMETARRDGTGIVFSGLAKGKDAALSPTIFRNKDTWFAFSAIGIGASGRPDFWPSDDRVGQLAYDGDAFVSVSERLGAVSGSFRILSVHAGLERQLTPTSQEVTRFRDVAVRTHDIDLVVGHHAHVVQGVQEIDGRYVFYGLGNFMHPGMQDMASQGTCRDYGLMARLHLVVLPGAKPVVAAVEAIPLKDMHIRPVAMPGDAARRRIGVLNSLSERLDDADTGAKGVRFAVDDAGTGLACTAASENLTGEIGRRCKTLLQEKELSTLVPKTALSQCGGIEAPGRLVASRRGNSVAGSRRGARATADATPPKRDRSLADELFRR